MRVQRLAGRFVVVSTLALGLGACRSGPTIEDAEGYLGRGEPEAALRAARDVASRDHEPRALEHARRIAFDASVQLGRSDEAARELLALETAPGERDRLLEKLAGTTLLAALESPDAGRRAIVAGDLALVAPHPKLQRLVDRALADREPGVREAALGALGRLTASESTVRLAKLVADDPSPEVREKAAQALAACLGNVRPNEPDELARARAVLAERAAQHAPGPVFGLASDDDLPEALASSDYTVRLAAVRAAGERLRTGHAGEWPRRLATLLEDPAEPVRAAVIDALALERDQASLLANVARTHASPATRRHAFVVLDRVMPLSTAELVRTLDEHDAAVAPEAARLLGERGGTAAVGPLVRALAQGGADRPAVARALGVLGGSDAIAALVRALAATDPVLRRAAAEGLARAGGSGVRDDLARAIERADGDADVAAAAALLATFAHPAGAGTTLQESP